MKKVPFSREDTEIRNVVLVRASEGRQVLKPPMTRSAQSEFRRGLGVGGAIRRPARGVAAKSEDNHMFHDAPKGAG